MIRIAKFITRHLFLTAFIALILIAVLITAARLFVPLLLGGYADEVSEMAGRMLGQPVVIGELDARWHGLGPEVVLRDVTLLSADSDQPVMALDEISVDFGLTDMIETGFLAPGRLSVEGTRLIIIRHADGRVSIQGIEAVQGGLNPLRGDASALVLTPPRLSITNAHIEFIDQMRDRPPLLLDNVNLHIRNDGGRHQMDLSLDIEGRPVEIKVDIQARERRLEDWAGDIYVRLTQAPLKGLPRTLLPPGYALTGGDASIELWSHWRQGMPEWIQSRVFATAIGVQRDSGITWRAGELSTHALWRQIEGGWQLELDHTTLAQQDRRHHIDRLSFARTLPSTTMESLNIRGTGLDIEVLTSLLGLGLYEGHARHLAAIDPSGRLTRFDLSLRPHAGPTFSVTGQVEGLSTKALGWLPQMRNLSAQVEATANGGHLLLRTRDASIHFTNLFRESIPLSSAEGQLSWQRRGSGWRLNSEALALRNAHIKTRTRFSLDLSPGASPQIDLRTDFRDGDGSRVSLYLPTAIMPSGLVDWLDRAIPQAHVPTGMAVLRGPLDKFPFRDPDSGRFEVLFGIENATLNYLEDWPALEELSADLHFLNDSLAIEGGTARVYQTRLHDLNARLEHLHPVSRLEITGAAEGELEDAQGFVRASPLAQKLAFIAAEDTRLSGQSRLELSLSIPLRDDDSEMVIEGSLTPKDGGLSLPRFGLDIEAVEGRLEFDRRGISAKRMTGKIDDAPVRVEIANTRAGVQIQGSGRFDTRSVKKRYPLLADAPFHGRSPWRLRIDLPASNGGRTPPARIEAESTLSGTRIDLPFGLGKTADGEMPFAASFLMDESPADGLTLRLGEYNAEVHRQEGDWGVSLDGPIAKGSLRIPGKNDAGPIRADLERLTVTIDVDALRQRPAEKTKSPLKPQTLPEVELSARRVLLNNHDYGALKARTVRIPGGIRLQEMTLASADGELQATGEWRESDAQQRTQLQADLQTRDFGRTMRDLRLSEGLSGSEGNLELLLNWQGGPLDARVETLNGELSISAEDGSFEEAEVGLGRLLGLTNITALTRRLRLDFTDLFSQGFAFDSLSGDFFIEGGVARTDNGIIEGPIGEIRIAGSTDMSTRQLDQKITVTPALSGAAAIAGVLAGGPAVGAAMLVAGKGLERLADVTYRMTGPWDAPQIERTGWETANEQTGPAKPDPPPPSHLLPIH